MIKIRQYRSEDWPAVWKMIKPVFRAGTTYAFDPEITEVEGKAVWVEIPRATYVALGEGGRLVGTYYIKANQPALGAHVCNCGYIVDREARGRGVASAMCEHSQQQAAALGFSAMQYNLVVATNEGAIRLWKKHGFEIIGTLPRSFRHKQAGLVDALVMYKLL